MLIVHVIGSRGLYTRDLYKFISEEFPKEEHCFLTDNKENNNFIKNGCRVINIKSFESISVLKRCDYVIAHGLVSSRMVALFSVPFITKKTVWIIWGGDIYYKNTPMDSLKRRLMLKVRASLYRKIRITATVSSRDYDFARKEYCVSSKNFEITYPVPMSNKIDHFILCANRAEGKTVSIQIGNSATRSNLHFEALDYLSKFADFDIKIFIPLSYGESDYKEYAKEVISYAEKIFPKEKLNILLTNLSGEEYLKILRTIDIGVFNNNRQQGMGNITQLMIFGAKIYMRSDVSMWDHLISLGCELNDIKELDSDISFDEFRFKDKKQLLVNQEIFRKRHSISLKRKQWEKMFEYLRCN